MLCLSQAYLFPVYFLSIISSIYYLSRSIFPPVKVLSSPTGGLNSFQCFLSQAYLFPVLHVKTLKQDGRLHHHYGRHVMCFVCRRVRVTFSFFFLPHNFSCFQKFILLLSNSKNGIIRKKDMLHYKADARHRHRSAQRR